MKTIGLIFQDEDAKSDTIDTPFQCPHCKNSYKEQKYLDNHIKKKHPDNV